MINQKTVRIWEETITIPTYSPRTYIINTLNTGNYVPGIHHNFKVGIPAIVSKHSIQPITTDGLPPALIVFALRDREMELAAYKQASRELLLQLILTDPWTQSKRQAQDLFEIILPPPWNISMREHYN